MSWKLSKRLLTRFAVPLVFSLVSLAVPESTFAKGSLIKVFMTPTGESSEARGWIEYRADPGHERLLLAVRGIPVGVYSLDSNGVSVGTFNMLIDTDAGGTKGHLKLSSEEATLPFDPRGAILDVSAGGVVYLHVSFPMTRDEAQRLLEVQMSLTNYSQFPDARGEALLKSKDGRSRFRVTVENLPPGSYDLYMDGLSQGSMDVDQLEEGEIQFDTRPGNEDEGTLLLTFDPRNHHIHVVQQGVVLLAVFFGGESGGGGGSSGVPGGTGSTGGGGTHF